MSRIIKRPFHTVSPNSPQLTGARFGRTDACRAAVSCELFNNGSRKDSAFSLIEALAALMLIAVVLPFAMRAITSSAQLGVYADREARALELADTKLAETMVNEAWRTGDSVGLFDPQVYGHDAGLYEWAVIVEDWNNVSYNQVTCIVTWTQRGKTRSVTLSTVVYAEEL